MTLFEILLEIVKNFFARAQILLTATVKGVLAIDWSIFKLTGKIDLQVSIESNSNTNVEGQAEKNANFKRNGEKFEEEPKNKLPKIFKETTTFEEDLQAGSEKVIIYFDSSNREDVNATDNQVKVLATKYVEVKIIHVDGEERIDLCIDYNIQSYPTFIFVKEGNIVDGYVGPNVDLVELILQKYFC